MGQNDITGKLENYLILMKMKIQHTKFKGCNENTAQRKIYTYKYPHLKKEISKINGLTVLLNKLGK